MKVLSKNRLQVIGSGAFGRYYKIKGTKRGVKVIHGEEDGDSRDDFSDYNEGCDDPECCTPRKTKKRKKAVTKVAKLKELKNCSLYKDAQQEFKFLKKASAVGLSPKPYEIVAIKGEGYNTNNYYPGIVMDHIDGESFRSFSLDDLKEELDNLLEKAGIDHGDLHDGNIMACVEGNKLVIKAVDFSPACANWIRKPKKRR